MSAYEHLSPAQFFHVTRHEFQPGELVTPAAMRGERNRFDEGSRKQNDVTSGHVYFSSDLGFLQKFGRVARTHAEMELPSRIYEVKPTGRYTRDRHTHSTEEAYKSREPLEVVSEVHVSPGLFRDHAIRRTDMTPDEWEQLHYPGRWAARQRQR